MTRVFKPDSGQNLEIQDEGGSAALTVETDGDVTVDAGNLVIPTADKGISFTGGTDPDTTGTATGNILNDYEEGTFTGVLDFGGESEGISYIADGQTGTYTKIGNMVMVKGFIGIDNNGSSPGDANISGLPFTSSSATRTNSVVSLKLQLISFADFPTGRLSSNASTINLYEVQNDGTTNTLTNSNFPDTAYLNFTVIYQVD